MLDAAFHMYELGDHHHHQAENGVFVITQSQEAFYGLMNCEILRQGLTWNKEW